MPEPPPLVSSSGPSGRPWEAEVRSGPYPRPGGAETLPGAADGDFLQVRRPARRKQRRRITAGRIACLAIVLFMVGDGLCPDWLRPVLEILIGSFAVLGLMFE